jgi:ornithine carbamoyltransferase
MAHTYLVAGALTGMDVAIATPPGYEADEAIVEQARSLAGRYGTGSDIAVGHDPRAAVAGADVVVTDTWASMGQEAEHERRLRDFAGFTVDDGLMAQADDEAVFMHCLPAHRGEEVSASVIDSPRSIVFDEAENRLHAQRAWMSLVL